MKKKIHPVLVTGANGFVGHHLVATLAAQGLSFNTASRSDRGPITANQHIQITTGDYDWSDALVSVASVIHLAARVHVMRESMPDTLSAFREANVDATANLAWQAAQAGVRRFVYVSSIKVNGELTLSGGTFREVDAPKPEDAYGISKWEAEQALWEIAHETGLEVVVVRPPLVYGPGVKANFAKLLALVELGVPFPFGAVKNSRSLIYVGNLVDALVACATHPVAAGKTYLISDGEDISTPLLISAIAAALDRPVRNVYVPVAMLHSVAKLLGKSSSIDRLTQSLVIDSSKIRNELNWSPPFTMTQGLRATADWYRARKLEQVL